MCRELEERLVVETAGQELIEGEQGRGGIRAPTAEAGRDGDALVHVERYTERGRVEADEPGERERSSPGEVLAGLGRYLPRQLRLPPDPDLDATRATGVCDRHDVVHRDREHDALDVVEAVGAAPQHAQEDVDLRVGPARDDPRR